MKLATLKDGSRDGLLAVVSRDLKTASIADGIAPTLQRALDDWNFIAPQLEELYNQLNGGKAKRPFEFNPTQCMAPLPRAYQWADGSVYLSHLQRMSAMAGVKWEDVSTREPMLYQGGSDDFIGGADDVVFAEESWGIDFEAEIGVILGDTPMQTKRDDALEHVRLVTLINDWSLRNLVAREIAKHFGFFQSKPATAFAPVVVTPDELGEAWKEALPHLNVTIAWNGVRFGQLNAAEGAKFNFADLITHAAKTRNLRAGTVLGLGTISNAGTEGGFATIAEKRAQEAIDKAAGHEGPQTEFMKFGDRVRIEVKDAAGHSLFGAVDQQVISLRRRRASLLAEAEAAAVAQAAADAVPAEDGETDASITVRE
ncbi:MAG: fumarylacetoacetate hydrolase family protein [Betaproteobacteria bacterium]|nr:fumarylacetoacetate hydrolase family protein [Betaproteobacteria bacterium]